MPFQITLHTWKTIPFCLQIARTSLAGRYGWHSFWTTAGLFWRDLHGSDVIWCFHCKLLEETATWEDCWPSSRQAALLIVLVRSCKLPGLPRFLQVLQVSKYFHLRVSSSKTWNMFSHEAVSFQPWSRSPVWWCHAGCVFRLHLGQLYPPSMKIRCIFIRSPPLAFPYPSSLEDSLGDVQGQANALTKGPIFEHQGASAIFATKHHTLRNFQWKTF